MKQSSVPNQRKITVDKSSKCDKTHLYTTINLETLATAANCLQTKAGFKLYMYLVKNRTAYEWYLSSKDFMEWAGVGYTAYTSAFKELEDLGYLKQKEDTETIFTFYDIPKNDKKDENTLIKVEYDKPTIIDEKAARRAYDAMWHT